MSQLNRKRIEIQRMQPVLVDMEGQVWSVSPPFFWMRPRKPDSNIVDYVVTNLGFIHIWSVDDSSIVVSLRPGLVHPTTMVAAFYEISDLKPVRVFVSTANTTKQGWEVFNSLGRALDWIDRLVSTAWRFSIGARLSRVWGCLRLNDIVRPPHASRLLCACKFTRRYGDAGAVASPRMRALDCTVRRQGKAATLARGLATAFLTSLGMVSSLSFAL